MKNVIFGILPGLLMLLTSFTHSPENRIEIVEDEACAIQVIKACHILGPPFGPLDYCTEDMFPLVLNEDSQATITTRVYAANLVGNGNPGEYTLPTGVHSIYLRISYIPNMPPQIVGPFDTFVPETTLGTAEPLYYCDIPFIVSLNSAFSLGGPCKENDPLHLLDFEMEMVTPNSGGTYDMYPIQTYHHVNNVFTCQIFKETCANCKNPACTELYDPIYNVQMCAVCSYILEDNSAGGGGNGPNFRLGAGDLKVAEPNTWESAITPNPFEHEVILEIDSEEQVPLTVEIFDATGKRVKNVQPILSQANTRQVISTDDLKPGMYFFRLSDGNKAATHKLVKLAN